MGTDIATHTHMDRQRDRQTLQYHDSAWPKGQGGVKSNGKKWSQI